jgi:hypothetical protein
MTSKPGTAYSSSLVIVATLVCVALAACGSASKHTSTTAPAATQAATQSAAASPGTAQGATFSGQTVAKVGPYTVTKAAVEHWMSVLVVTDKSDIPKTNDPKLVVPQPPDYTTCVTNAQAGLTGTSNHLTATAIKQKCALLRQALQEQAVELLISTDQLLGKSAERRVTASDGEVRRHLNKLVREEFPSQAAFQRYLRFTRQPLADQLYRVKSLVLTTKLLLAYGLSSGTPSASQQQYFTQVTKHWVAATSCRTGYVVPSCSQYKASAAAKPGTGALIQELAL